MKPSVAPKIQRQWFILSAMLAFVSLQLFVGCAQPRSGQTAADPQIQTKAAIQSVMNQYNAATVDLTNSLAALGKNPLVGFTSKPDAIIQHYIDSLRAIDISNCPDDFRLTFVKFYQAWQVWKTNFDANTGWRGALKGFTKPLSIFSVPDNTDKAAKPLDEAGRELVLVCTKYGLHFQ